MEPYHHGLMFSIQSSTENALFEGEPSCRGWKNFISMKLWQGVYQELLGWKGNPTTQAAKETSCKNGGKKL